MNYILFDNHINWQNLLPLTFTKPISELRIGILTIKEKWEKYLNTEISSYKTEEFLSEKFPSKIKDNNILINSSVLPDENIISQIYNLQNNECIIFNNNILAINLTASNTEKFLAGISENYTLKKANNVDFISFPWDIFSKNENEIKKDFKLLTSYKKSKEISSTNRFFNSERIFLEEGAKVECSILNPENGYIYIGKGAEIMEGSIVRGSLAMCECSTLKLGAKIYGATTIGPFSKIGGEVNNSVITGYSSKAHDGFLGNSVLGEWCNLGADTNNSNLKNNYLEVKSWNYSQEHFIKTGLQFSGLIMGDHSKCGINTMFNTGTVVGVSANIFGSGFPRNFIPSFSWGGALGFDIYTLEKALKTAEIVMKRRNKELNPIEIKIFENIFNMTKKYRNY